MTHRASPDELRAAWLTLDPGRRAADRLRDPATAVVSHRSAAGLHGLGDLDADEHEFTTQGRKQSRRPGIRLHRGRVGAGEWTVVDGMPVTTVLRTVADLAAARVDGGHLASVVGDALTVKQVGDQELSAVLRPYAHRYGAPLGDGEAPLARFIQESGVSEPLGRAVELAGGSTMTSAALGQTLRQITAIIVAEHALPADALEQIRELVVPVDLAEISRLTEQLRQAVSTPQVQRRMAEQAGKEQ